MVKLTARDSDRMKYFIMALAFLLFSCNNKSTAPSEQAPPPPLEKNYVKDAAKKMTRKQIVSLIGEPTRKDDLGTSSDEKGDTSHVEIWYYGSNQAITFVNDSVTGIDYNTRESDARVQHRIDSATQAERR